jgi:hypothetical protein
VRVVYEGDLQRADPFFEMKKEEIKGFFENTKEKEVRL